MRGFRSLGFFLILAVAACASNKEVVRDSTKNLMKKYRGEINQRIAVFPFMTKSQQKLPELSDFDDEVMDIVFEDKRFQIVERSLVEQISKEWTFSESGMVDEQQRSKIGRLSGAKLILVPIISSQKNINMRIISVNSGDVLSYIRNTLASPIIETVAPTGRRSSSHASGGGSTYVTPPSGGGSITLGGNASGNIAPGQIDNYTFNLRNSKSVEIRADRTDSSFDPFLELRNSSGGTIATDDDGGGGLNSKIATFLSAGSYIIAVKAYNTSNSGSYRLTVNEAMDQQVSSGGTGNFGDLLIQLETSINFSAQTDSWRSRRSSWLNDVRGASGNLRRMRELVLEFETNIRSNSQNSSWLSNSRSNWVQRVRNANSIGALATLVMECESNILYSAQSSGWRNTRTNWTSQMQSLQSH